MSIINTYNIHGLTKFIEQYIESLYVFLDKCSEPNEEYTNCKRTCPPELCISIIALFNCKADEPCEAGCACKPGHYRQQNNTSCIPACQCQEMEGTPECRATIEQ